MKFRGQAEETGTREETRELAEALSLFGSAVRHAADRRAGRMPMPSAGERERRPGLKMRLVVAPALAVAAAIAVGVPAYSHFERDHGGASRQAAAVQQEENTETRASVNDTVLMNQIDSDLSEDVPDALQPLAELSEQAATNSTTTEKKNATQE